MSEEMKNQVICAFCNKEWDDVNDLLFFMALDEKTHICEDCIELAALKIEERMANIEEELMADSDMCSLEPKLLLKPSEIQAFLNDYVIGQEHAKKILSVAIYNHYKMLRNKDNEDSDIELDKSNILLVGPTGAGKHHTV